MGIFLVTYSPKLICYFRGIFQSKKPTFKKAKKEHRFAVLVPARDESKVIRDLLDSLKNQDYNKDMFETFVVVEKRDDPTVQICSEYENVTVLYKKDMSRNGKGYVMEEAVDYILKEREDAGFEALLVFDADNVPALNFISYMNDALDSGCDVCVGNRNSKNWNDGWISSCTGLTFIKFSRFQNYGKMKMRMINTLSGTGYFIKMDIIKRHGGWLWHSITEDVQVGMVCAINNYKTAYCKEAEFLDEQPTDFKTSFKQRKRWIKGFFVNGSKYHKRLFNGMFTKECNRRSCLEYTLGAIPLISMALAFIVGILGMMVGAIIFSTYDIQACYEALVRMSICFGIYYVLMMIDASLMLIFERKRLDITFKNGLIAVIFHPIFSAIYIAVAVCALFQKIEWEVIEHKVNVKISA